jgi:PAS domain S-box-containing protein
MDDLNTLNNNNNKERVLLSLLLNNSNALVANVDTNLNYRFVNKAYEDWFEINANELVGKSAMIILGIEGFKKIESHIKKCLAGEYTSFEKEVPYNLGTRFVKTHMFPEFDEYQNVKGMYVVSYDKSDLAKAENTLEIKNTEFSTIMNNIPIMIGQWDADLRNIHANDHYSHFFKLTPAEIKGMHIRDLLGEELFDKNLYYIENALAGRAQVFEREMKTAEGRTRYTLANYIPNIINGQVVGFFTTVTDITNVKQRNIEVQNQKNFYSEILNTIHDGFVVQDKNAKVLHFNKSACNILGLTEEQILGTSSFDPNWQAIREDGSPFPRSEHPSVVTINTGLPQKNIIMGIKNNNTNINWIKINSVPFETEFENEKSAVLVTFSDVTEELKKTKMIAGIIQNSPGMIYQFRMNPDYSMEFPFASSKAYDICETPEDIFMSDSAIMLRMVHPEDKDNLNQSILKSAEELTPFEWTGRIITPSGKTKWIKAKSLPHQEKDNGSVLWDGLLIDISREIQIEEELAQERLRTSHSAKLASLGELSAGVAHEINNPLAIIFGLTKQLPKYANDPIKLQNKIGDIEKSVHRISKIVNGLKRFARQDIESKRGYFNLDYIYNQVSTYFEIKTNQEYINLNINLNSNLSIFCDPTEIEQVFINLINNSVDAIKDLDEKWISISSIEKDNEVIINFIDSGKGIPDKIANNLFNPFFTTKEIGQGTGLGLSIVNGIIHNHGGKVSVVKNHPNTCFEIRLPINQEF